jgi:hypothetical protein
MATEKKKVRDFLLLVDTNAIWTDDEDLSRVDLLSVQFRQKWDQISAPGDVTLSIPDVAIVELAYQKQRFMLKAHQEARASLGKMRQALGLGIPEIPQMDPARLGSAVEQKLRAQVNETPHCTTTPIPYPVIASRMQAIINASLWRLPPFEHGKTEKGFRDAIILETVRFVQADQPHRDVALISRDNRLREAVQQRLAGASNFGLFKDLADYEKFLELARSRFTPEFLHGVSEAAPSEFKANWMSLGVQQRLIDAYNLKIGELAFDSSEGSTEGGAADGFFRMISAMGKAMRCVGAPEFSPRETRLLAVVGSDEFHWETRVVIITPYAEPRGMLSPEPASDEASRFRAMAVEVEWSARVSSAQQFSEMQFLREHEIVSRFYESKILGLMTISGLADLL